MTPHELIDTIFLSDKRERFLLLLLEGPTDIKKSKRASKCNLFLHSSSNQKVTGKRPCLQR
jgi:predicted transcriptional regulator